MSDPTHSEALAREVKRALSAAGLSAPAAATKLGWDRKRLYRWMDGSVSPQLSALDKFSRTIGQPLTVRLGKAKEPPEPEWLEGLVREIRMNREAIREAMLGPDQPDDAALVEMVKDDLRPLFEGLAAQFRGEVQQLLAERFGETDKD